MDREPARVRVMAFPTTPRRCQPRLRCGLSKRGCGRLEHEIQDNVADLLVLDAVGIRQLRLVTTPGESRRRGHLLRAHLENGLQPLLQLVANSRNGYMAGIAWRAASATSCSMRLLKKGSVPTSSAPVRT